MSKVMAWAAVVTLFAPTGALANGGPIRFTEGTAAGNVQPLSVEGVTLVDEDLRIHLDDDGDHYDVTARYALDNTGAGRAITYGVPLVEATEAEPTTIAAAASVQVQLGGQKAACRLVTTPPSRLDPDALAKGWPTKRTLRWCSTEITVPPGRSTLTLSYRGELDLEDSESSFSRLADYFRALRYALFPAGYWSGRVQHFRAEVDLGLFAAGAEVEKPQGVPFTRAGGRIVWDVRDADLARLDYLAIKLASHDVLIQREALALNASADYRRKLAYRARASSVLAGESSVSYGPEMAFDGRRNTAWCEGVNGSGIGQWLEVELKPSLEDGLPCHLTEIGVVVGYAHDDKRLLSNNRPRALRLSDCEDPKIGFDYPLTVPTEAHRAIVMIPLQAPPPHGDAPVEDLQGLIALMDRCGKRLEVKKRMCYRLTILDVVRGAHDDTCITEVIPVFGG